MTWMLPLSVLLSIVLGFFAPPLHRAFAHRLGRFLALWPFGLFLYFLRLAPRIASGDVVQTSFRWFTIPSDWLGGADGPAGGVDVNVGFTLDGLALLFVLLITGVGALVLFYAGGYLAREEDHGKFFSYMMLFVGAMLGVVLADNLFALYMFWEATSVTSFLLIGFWSHREASRQGALKALLVTVAGGLALLAGAALLLVVTGSTDLATILAAKDGLHAGPLYGAVTLLVLLGAFTKSAQAPFHLWLPNAMEAPTPVSAYLHSAAMVKAGVYLIARMSAVLGGTLLWTVVVSSVGVVSLVLGAYLALRQTDLKAILAYSTISQLGLIVALFGWSTPLAVAAAVFHILNHSVFKAALFMVVGIVDRETGTRDVGRLRGLATVMPVTAAVALVAALALAGVPPLNGFVSKEMFFAAAVAPPAAVPAGSALAWLFPALAVVGSTLTFVYALKISHGVFYKRGPAPSGPGVSPSGETSADLWGPPAVLAAAAIALGVAPGLVDAPIVASAAAAVLGRSAEAPLALWHGVNGPLLMSLAVIAVGWGAYARSEALEGALARVPTRLNVNALYDWSLDALAAVSEFVEARLLTGFTRDYVAYLLGFFLALLSFTVGRIGPFPLQLDWPPQGTLQWTELVFALLVAGVTLCLPFIRSRVAAVIALGSVGTSLVMLWTLFQAPDLALSMLVVETVGLLLFLLVFVYLPRLRRDVFPRLTHWVNVLIAGSAGVAVTWLLLGARGVRLTRPISDWYLENSLPAAHGTNVVNVILVDFRGYDTLFEITVLGLAGLGVYILSNLRFKGGRK